MLGVFYKYKAMKIQSDFIKISEKVLDHASFKNIGYYTHDTPSVKEEGRSSHKSKASKVPARITFDLHCDITRQQNRHEILECQIKEVRNILRYCTDKKIKRIELIHGGNQNTPLRNSIWAILKSHYGKKNARWSHPTNNPGTTEIDFT
jgi:hypothetical protein